MLKPPVRSFRCVSSQNCNRFALLQFCFLRRTAAILFYPPASLPLLVRKKSRLLRLFACKRALGVSAALPTFLRVRVYFKILLRYLFCYLLTYRNELCSFRLIFLPAEPLRRRVGDIFAPLAWAVTCRAHGAGFATIFVDASSISLAAAFLLKPPVRSFRCVSSQNYNRCAGL